MSRAFSEAEIDTANRELDWAIEALTHELATTSIAQAVKEVHVRLLPRSRMAAEALRLADESLRDCRLGDPDTATLRKIARLYVEDLAAGLFICPICKADPDEPCDAGLHS